MRGENATVEPALRCDKAGEGDAQQAVFEAATCGFCKLYALARVGTDLSPSARPTALALKGLGGGTRNFIPTCVLDAPFICIVDQHHRLWLSAESS